MPDNTYLEWVLRNTSTKWWHDSAEAGGTALGLQRGAIGVTTNPFLANLALVKRPRSVGVRPSTRCWRRNCAPEQKAEALMQIAVTRTAEKLMTEFEGHARANRDSCAAR